MEATMEHAGTTARELEGRVALITGAANRRGIGMGAAECLAAMGCNLVITDLGFRSAELDAKAVALSDASGISALPISMDVTDRASVDAGVRAAFDHFGRLDVVINNAGTVFGAPSPLHAYDEAEWSRTLDVNLNGTLRVSQAAVALMEHGGSIINIASMAGKVPAPSNGAYSVSKAAIMMLTRVMAVELGRSGIRVNAICPGLIDTDLQRLNVALKAHVAGLDEAEAERRMLDSVPIGRMGTIQEVGDLCAFLASDRSSYLTGQSINATGGMLTAI